MGNLKLSAAEEFNQGHTGLARGELSLKASETVLPLHLSLSLPPRGNNGDQSFLNFSALWN